MLKSFALQVKVFQLLMKAQVLSVKDLLKLLKRPLKILKKIEDTIESYCLLLKAQKTMFLVLSYLKSLLNISSATELDLLTIQPKKVFFQVSKLIKVKLQSLLVKLKLSQKVLMIFIICVKEIIKEDADLLNGDL